MKNIFIFQIFVCDQLHTLPGEQMSAQLESWKIEYICLILEDF